MSKKNDVQFDDEEQFLKDNPKLTVTRPVPNYAAIRAILRSGAELEGCRLVEIETSEKSPGDAAHKPGMLGALLKNHQKTS